MIVSSAQPDTAMDDALPSDLRITAQIRIATRAGIPMTVLHKGHAQSGTIYLKLNRLDGTAEVLSQIRLEGELVWLSASDGKPVPEREADAYLQRQTDFDSDAWVIEIEDKQGRHWFPEKIIDSIA
ncbi:MAG: DUF1491 family protein [Alphaproteobacteria bacterium]|nr:DUF1491 family protein [Alphaproteobacteria bacterium]